MVNFLNIYIVLFIYLLPIISIAQENNQEAEEDLKYREDQFYLGINYNLITGVPSGVKLKGVSGGVQLGYLRDMPINKKRTIAVAVGLGMSMDQYGQNLAIDKNALGTTTFTILEDDAAYKSNRFSVGTLELPLEFRWRNSTPTNYKFLRIYTGFRLGYSFWHKSNFRSSAYNISRSNLPEFEKLRLGTTLSIGYSTFNLFAHYSILPFFKETSFTNLGQRVDFTTLKVGLIFYVL